MRNKLVGMFLILCLFVQVETFSVSALTEAYHSGPKTLELTEENCQYIENAKMMGGRINFQPGGTVRFGFYLPFDAESVTISFADSKSAIYVNNGVESFVVESGEQKKVTYMLETASRVGEQTYIFSAKTSTQVNSITLNKKPIISSLPDGSYVLPEMSEEEIIIENAVLIDVQASAIMVDGSTRYINTDVPDEKPLNIGGNVYLPVHVLARAFGAYYEEIPENGYVLFRHSRSKIEMMFTTEWSYIEKDGQREEITNMCYQTNGNMYLPVRFVAESLGLYVGFNNGLIAIDDNRYYVEKQLEAGNVRDYIDATLAPFKKERAEGTTYYVAQTENANDANPGTAELPFKTLSKAGAIAQSGDTVIVGAGIYRETLTVQNNGTATSPIVFQAAEGEEVVISALEPIDGFRRLDKTTYVASFPWDLGDGRNQIFYQGSSVPEARYPNGPGITMAEGNNTLSDNWMVKGDLITDPDNCMRVTSDTLLNQTVEDYWKGAYFVTVRGYGYATSTARVQSSKYGELYLEDTSTIFWDERQQNVWNYGYLVGHRNAMDLPGEWVIENNVLFMVPPKGETPESLRVEAKRRQLVADLADNQYVQLRGFTTIGGSMRLNDAEMCVIDNCEILYNNHYILSKDQHSGFIDDANVMDENGAPTRGEVGIYIGGRNNVFTNNVVKEAAGAAIYSVGLYGYFENNYIANCGYGGSYVAGISLYGTAWKGQTYPNGGNLIVQNTVYNAGRSPLNIARPAYQPGVWPMVANEIAFNDFHDGMLTTLDTGITYTYFVDHGNSRKKTQMHGNLIYYTLPETNPFSMGIYHDGCTQNIDTYENVVFTTEEDVIYTVDDIHIQPDEAALAVCNSWNNMGHVGIEGGRDGLLPEHYPDGKPYDAGSTIGRETYLVNYIARSLEAPATEDIIVPTAAADGVEKGENGTSRTIVADGQWVLFEDMVFDKNISQINLFYQADKYKFEGTDGSLELAIDDLESSKTYDFPLLEITTTYVEHSRNNCSIRIPRLSGKHDVYVKANGEVYVDILGINLNTSEQADVTYLDGFFGGNFDEAIAGDTSLPPKSRTTGKLLHPFVNNTWNGTVLIYKDVELTYSSDEIAVNLASADNYVGQKVRLHIGSSTAQPIAEFESYGVGWTNWTEKIVPLQETIEPGVYDLYLTFEDDTGEKSCNFYYLQFLDAMAKQ